MTIQSNANETEAENIIFRVANFPVRLFPRRKKQTQSSISNKEEGEEHHEKWKRSLPYRDSRLTNTNSRVEGRRKSWRKSPDNARAIDLRYSAGSDLNWICRNYSNSTRTRKSDRRGWRWSNSEPCRNDVDCVLTRQQSLEDYRRFQQ